jgi:streptogramin lyase
MSSLPVASWNSLLLAMGFVCGAASSALAGGFEGRITRSEAPVAGAMVTARAAGTGIETTVFSDAKGVYRLDGLAPGPFEVGVRAPGTRAASRTLRIEGDALTALSFAVMDDPAFLERVTSAAWLDLLPEGERKREFILNCTSCHEISHGRVMRGERPRSAAEWLSAIALMRSIDVYGLTPPDFHDASYAEWLARHLEPTAVAKLAPGGAATGPALRARVTEYPVPKTPSLPHDVAVGPDGRVYITAFYNNAVWALDATSGKIETFPVNEKPEVMGQVRALAFDAGGALWTLLGGTESLVRLHLDDGAIRTFPLGMYPHSIEVDSQGRLWFNDYLSASKRIGVMDPKNGNVTIHEIPGEVLREGEGLPLLYGLQIDAADTVWGTMLAANKLFRFDPKSGDTHVFEMPAENTGPRRPGIGPDGAVWIPEFNTGTLTRFDPQTETFERHALGRSTLGPYDVAVDPRTGHVWVAAALGSALIRFDPATKRRDVFPFPTEPAYPRHIAIHPESGDVWTTYSSMPDAVPKIVRIELRDS